MCCLVCAASCKVVDTNPTHNTRPSPGDLYWDEAAWFRDFTLNIRKATLTVVEVDKKKQQVAGVSKQNEPLPARPQTTQDFKLDVNNYSTPSFSKQTFRTIRLNELVTTPEKYFVPKATARLWIEDYQEAAEVNNWDDEIMIKYFPTFLTGSAKLWFSTLIQPDIADIHDWSMLKSKFLRYYVGKEKIESLKEEISRTRQLFNEPASEFIPRLLCLLLLADPFVSTKEKVRCIKSKLKSSYQDKLIGHEINSIEKLNDLCLEIEARFDASKQREAAAARRQTITGTSRETSEMKSYSTKSHKIRE